MRRVVVDKRVAVDKGTVDKWVVLQSVLPLVEQTALRMMGKLELHTQRGLHISDNIENLQT